MPRSAETLTHGHGKKERKKDISLIKLYILYQIELNNWIQIENMKIIILRIFNLNYELISFFFVVILWFSFFFVTTVQAKSKFILNQLIINLIYYYIIMKNFIGVIVLIWKLICIIILIILLLKLYHMIKMMIKN